MVRASSAVGPILRRWREAKSLSQERLAAIAEVSTRHVSFVETGKAAPSREMVLVLGNALGLPLRERNALLLAAGFAPVYRVSALDGDALRPVRRALDHILAKQEPYGAVVVDRAWNVLLMNQGATRMLTFFLEGIDAPREALANVVTSIFHPRGLRPFIVNWEDVAAEIVERLHREIAVASDDDERRAVLAQLLAYEGVPARFGAPSMTATSLPFIAVHLKRGDVEVRLFTTITTLGTPLDVTAEELRIESYFPADEATEKFVERLAAGRS